jgi:pyruvate kinase
MVEYACETAAAERLAGPGDLIAIAAGLPFGVAGSTNLLRLEHLPDEPANDAGERP